MRLSDIRFISGHRMLMGAVVGKNVVGADIRWNAHKLYDWTWKELPKESEGFFMFPGGSCVIIDGKICDIGQKFLVEYSLKDVQFVRVAGTFPGAFFALDTKGRVF